jgi:hypothetical protein
MTNNEVIARCIVAGGLYVIIFAMFVVAVQSCAPKPAAAFDRCPFCNQITQ